MTSDVPNAAASALRERLRLHAELERKRRGEPEITEPPAPTPAVAPPQQEPQTTRPQPKQSPRKQRTQRKQEAQRARQAQRTQQTQHVATVLGHLVAERFDDAVATWKQHQTQIDLADDRASLVGDLVSVATLVPRELVLILARGIVRNALSPTYPPLVDYARTQQETAANAILQLLTTTLAARIGDVLLDPRDERDEAEPDDERDEIEPDDEQLADDDSDAIPTTHPQRHGRSAIWLFAGVLVAVISIGVVISRAKPTQPAPQRGPVTVTPMRSAEAAAPVHEDESRTTALREIRRSAHLLVQNGWTDTRTELDQLVAALDRSDCDLAMQLHPSVHVLDSETLAREHQTAIRRRLWVICGQQTGLQHP